MYLGYSGIICVSGVSTWNFLGHRLCSSEVLICAREIFWFGWFYKALFRTQGYHWKIRPSLADRICGGKVTHGPKIR